MAVGLLEDSWNVVKMPKGGILPLQVSPNLGERDTHRRQLKSCKRLLNPSFQSLRSFVRTGGHSDKIPTAQENEPLHEMGLRRKTTRFCATDYLGTVHLEMRFQVRDSLFTFSVGHRPAVSSQVEDAPSNDASDVWRIGAEVRDPDGRKPKNYRAFAKPGAAVRIQRTPPFGVGFIQIRYQNRVTRRCTQVTP